MALGAGIELSVWEMDKHPLANLSDATCHTRDACHGPQWRPPL